MALFYCVEIGAISIVAIILLMKKQLFALLQWCYCCPNATLLEITCCGSYLNAMHQHKQTQLLSAVCASNSMDPDQARRISCLQSLLADGKLSLTLNLNS